MNRGNRRPNQPALKPRLTIEIKNKMIIRINIMIRNQSGRSNSFIACLIKTGITSRRSSMVRGKSSFSTFSGARVVSAPSFTKTAFPDTWIFCQRHGIFLGIVNWKVKMWSMKIRGVQSLLILSLSFRTSTIRASTTLFSRMISATIFLMPV